MACNCLISECALTLIKLLVSLVPLILLRKNVFIKRIVYGQSFKPGDELAKEDYLQKYFFFLAFELSVLNVTVLEGNNSSVYGCINNRPPAC